MKKVSNLPLGMSIKLLIYYPLNKANHYLVAKVMINFTGCAPTNQLTPD